MQDALGKSHMGNIASRLGGLDVRCLAHKLCSNVSREAEHQKSQSPKP